jgi:hypothetical protein
MSQHGLTLPEKKMAKESTISVLNRAEADGKWMFVNLQIPGLTLAITGPWESGPFELVEKSGNPTLLQNLN